MFLKQIKSLKLFRKCINLQGFTIEMISENKNSNELSFVCSKFPNGFRKTISHLPTGNLIKTMTCDKVIKSPKNLFPFKHQNNIILELTKTAKQQLMDL